MILLLVFYKHELIHMKKEETSGSRAGKPAKRHANSIRTIPIGLETWLSQ
jgi:hypothetical protein